MKSDCFLWNFLLAVLWGMLVMRTKFKQDNKLEDLLEQATICYSLENSSNPRPEGTCPGFSNEFSMCVLVSNGNQFEEDRFVNLQEITGYFS